MWQIPLLGIYPKEMQVFKAEAESPEKFITVLSMLIKNIENRKLLWKEIVW